MAVRGTDATVPEATGRNSEGGFAIRRILAAFGPGTLSARALMGAVDLAARLGAELETLFVEDTALLGLTELPFMRQIGPSALLGDHLLRFDLELQLRALAAEGERRLAELATERRVKSTFQSVRGPIAASVDRAAQRADLLILGSSSRPIAREARLDPSVRGLVTRATRPVLLLRAEPLPGAPVHVLIETAREAIRLLDAALTMAARCSAEPVVRAWAADHETMVRLQGVLAADTARTDLVRLRTLRRPGSGGLQELIEAGAEGIVVLSAASRLLGQERWWQGLAGAGCTFLLVR